MCPLSALASKLAMTPLLPREGSCSRSRAAAPDTWGQAIEVPLKDREPVSELEAAEVMALPGAKMSLQVP